MKKLLLTLTAAMLLSACSSASQVVSSEAYHPETEARLRVYGQNQKPTLVAFGGKQMNAGSSFGDAFSSLMGTVKSTSLGMPATETSRSIANRNGLLSRAFFREIAVPAGQPVRVKSTFLGLSNRLETPTRTEITHQRSCQSDWVTFTPQAGKDYEAIVPNSASCGVEIFEVGADGSLSPISQ